MKAIVYETYGPPDVLEFREIDPPTVGDDELLVRVCAAGINPYDWHYLRGLPYLVRLVNGVRRPRHLSVLGSDMAGVVEAVGAEVTEFGPGDEVYAEVGTGGCAEYIAIPADQAGMKPRDLTFEQAAAVPMAAETALQGVRETGKGGARAPRADQRRVGWRRHVRGADRQGARR